MVLAMTLLSFMTVTLAVIGCYQLITGREQVARSRVERFVSAGIDHPVRSGTEGRAVQSRATLGKAIVDEPVGREVSALLRTGLREFSRLFEAQSLSERIETEIQRAGVSLRGSEFVALMTVGGVSGSFLGYWLAGTLSTTAGFGVGFVLPRMWLGLRAAKRLRAFNNQITDCLTMISGALKAGYSFLQAMEMVAREMPPPVSEEFQRSLKEMNLGVPTEEALTEMAERIGSDDLDLVVTAVLIQRQVGGNLAEVLDNIAFTVRERIRIKGEIKTLTAQGRISGLVISLLPVGIASFVFMVNPGYIMPLFSTAAGKIMLVIGVIGQNIGAVVIRKIVNIEV